MSSARSVHQFFGTCCEADIPNPTGPFHESCLPEPHLHCMRDNPISWTENPRQAGGRAQAGRGGAAAYGCWPGVGGRGWAELAGRLGRPSRVSGQLQNPDPQGPVPDFGTYCFLNNPTEIRYRTPPGNPVFVNTRPLFSGGADGRTGQPGPVECQLICVGKHGPGLLRKTSNIKYHKSKSQ